MLCVLLVASHWHGSLLFSLRLNEKRRNQNEFIKQVRVLEYSKCILKSNLNFTILFG